MEITASGGQFFVGMMRFGKWKYRWNKDKTLGLSATEETSVMVTTYRGDFIEVVDVNDKVTAEGGGGDWFYVAIPAKSPIKLRFKMLPKPLLTKDQIKKRRAIVTRCLVSDSPYGLGVPNKLSGAIGWMRNQLNKIPTSCRKSAKIDFSSRYEYGESYENIKITYSEPETDDELILRLQVETEEARIKTNRERQQFSKLKQQFCPDEAKSKGDV